MNTRRKALGFSLLEVMVALAILGVTLTALFAAEVGAFKASHSAHRMTEGTLLARCKMAELEADILESGLQATTVEEEEEPCCADEEHPHFTCDWKVELLEVQNLESDEVGGADNNPLGSLLGGGDDSSPADPRDLAEGATTADFLADGPGAASGMLSGLAGDYLWPLMAPSLAAQVRRVEVTVRWGNDDSFNVVQYVVVEPGAGVSDTGLSGGVPTQPPLGGPR